MDTLTINWLAVFVASLSSFIIGAVWFGPKTFYPVWMKALGRRWPAEQVTMTGAETALMFGGTYIAALVQVVSLAVVLAFARVAGAPIDAGSGALIGFALALGFGAFASVSHRMFGQADHNVFRSLKVWIIEVGQDIVCVTIAGAILGAWV